MAKAIAIPAAEPPSGKERKPKERSPSFPFINLEDAIKRARELYAKEGKNETKREIAATHWDYAAKSSGGLQTLAALKSFGLLEGQKGKVKLSQRALRIILDERPESEERHAAIEDASLSPRIHGELWRKYGKNLPSDVTLKTELQLEKEFTADAAARLIKEYKETINYAGLLDSDKLPTSGEPQQENKPLGGNIMPQTQEVSQVTSAKGLPPIGLTLPRDNYLEIRLRSKLSSEEFTSLLNLLRFALVDDGDQIQKNDKQ